MSFPRAANSVTEGFKATCIAVMTPISDTVMNKPRRSGPSSLVQLRIELAHSQPLIWRTVLVPDNITLVRLHKVIQAAMGWWDEHLHEFIIGHRHYGQVFDDDPMYYLGPELIDERRKKLLKLLGRSRKFEYLYDFGDNWRHHIRVEGLSPRISPRPHATCIAGEMACPPEDVGGLGGYFKFLEAVMNPRHEEHQNMIDWYGGRFDPAACNIIEINERLRQIKL